ncbi:MAG: histidinol-phosphate transaminase [Planctomycetia bacterium]|nr:histidinol-phosphate transaminase [Planctomycetia bacterium]
MSLIRPNIDRMAGYVPGEQPQDSGWTKLNTNENPYLPSPKVADAITRAANGRLNVYPDPLGTQVRREIAEQFNVDPDWVIPANGSDENLTLITRTFCDADDLIAYPYPSYILYESLAEIQGARHERILLNADWSWNWEIASPIIERAKVVFLPNPNSPSGNIWSDGDLLRLIPPNGVLVLDGAYADFADTRTKAELLSRPGVGERVIVTRTLSKSYSLAGIRSGFAIAHPNLIAAMRKVKDSYNCDSLTLAGTLAALQDEDWMLANVDRIRTTRARLTESLEQLGFNVVPSQSNFVWATRPNGGHREIYESLKAQKILVRYMRFPEVPYALGNLLDGLRITVGTDPEIDRLLGVLQMKEVG